MAHSSKGRGARFGPTHTASGPTNPQAKQRKPPLCLTSLLSQTRLQGRKPGAALHWLGDDLVLRNRFTGSPQRACCLQNARARFALGKLLS